MYVHLCSAYVYMWFINHVLSKCIQNLYTSIHFYTYTSIFNYKFISKCMYIYTSIHIYVYIYLYIYTHKCLDFSIMYLYRIINIDIFLYICIGVCDSFYRYRHIFCIYVQMHVLFGVHMRVYDLSIMYLSICICKHTRMYIYTYIHIYFYIFLYIYTYIQTHV